jgi:[ribosomal protein S18]-alanine N-acetyltransferase
MMSEDALDAVMAVMDSSFDSHWREAWTRAQVSDSLQMPSTFLQLCDSAGNEVSGGRAAGFVLSRQALDEEELLLIAVHPEARGRGLGTRLLKSYMSAARRRGVRRIFLEMRANNPAHALYKRCGFAPIGTRPRYYLAADGQAIDAITFAHDIDD